MSFVDKVVLVTGGSSGIGASAAIAFAKEGAKVCIVGRNEIKLNAVADKCDANGHPAFIIKADVSNPDNTRSIIDKVIKRYGKIDVLINNAGIARSSKIEDENHLAVYDEIMNTNLRPVVLLTNLAAKYLKASKGNIINVSSVAGSLGMVGSLGFGFSLYAASKAAMNQYTRICAMELSGYGIRVNAISPGPVETPILEGLDGEKPDMERLKSATALRMVSKPEEIADLMVYLASDKAKSVTGSNYVIDAGFLVNPVN